MAGFFFESRHAICSKIASNDCRDLVLIDTYDGAPSNMDCFRELNPFTTWPEPSIIVPGANRRSRSLEAVWQGLKIVRGKTDLAMLDSAPVKRPTDAERRIRNDYRYSDSQFAYGNRIIDLITARFLIYVVAYIDLIDRVVDLNLIESIADLGRTKDVVFFDWDSCGDICEENSSFSHSALLASWFSGNLQEDIFTPAGNVLTAQDFIQFKNSISERMGRYKRINRWL